MVEAKAIGKLYYLWHNEAELIVPPRGTPGDESLDYGYKFTNARRRSNSSSHGHSIGDFKTKFEAVEADPVFEEEYHGAKDDAKLDEHLGLEKRDSADSISGGSIEGSIEEEEHAKKV